MFASGKLFPVTEIRVSKGERVEETFMAFFFSSVITGLALFSIIN